MFLLPLIRDEKMASCEMLGYMEWDQVGKNSPKAQGQS